MFNPGFNDMSSVSVILRLNKPLKDGTFPLAIQIIKNRKPAVLHLGYSITDEQWDEESKRVRKSHPNSARLNNFIKKRLSEASDTKLELETNEKNVTIVSIKQKIKPSGGSTFFSQAESYLTQLKDGGKYNQYTADKPRIGHFKEFIKGDIAFSDITSGLLERFVVHLKSNYTPKGKKKRISDRTIANHLATVRSIFAHARKNGIIKREETPFGDGGIKISFPETNKIGISEEDIVALETVTLSNPQHDHARKLWLFTFYFAGMRVSDALRLKWSDFQDYRLHYSMGKNDKSGSLKIPDKAVKILKYYEEFKTDKDDLIFPELKEVDLSNEFITQRTIAFKTSALDKTLRKFVAPAAKISHGIHLGAWLVMQFQFRCFKSSIGTHMFQPQSGIRGISFTKTLMMLWMQ
jgi:integrase